MMDILSILKKTRKNKYIILSESELKTLLAGCEILQEKETHISDKIRLLKFKGELIIQEKSNKDEFLIRPVKTKKEADDFIEERLEIYNRMWDGCGCRVDYYN